MMNVFKKTTLPLLSQFLRDSTVFNLNASTMSCSPGSVISFDQLKEYIKEKSIYLIDVREKQELQATGILPDSINIPLNEILTALLLPEEQFKETYHRDKPKFDDKIVFSCRSGRRSDTAMQAALQLGFKDCHNYGGGWLEWEIRHRN